MQCLCGLPCMALQLPPPKSTKTLNWFLEVMRSYQGGLQGLFLTYLISYACSVDLSESAPWPIFWKWVAPLALFAQTYNLISEYHFHSIIIRHYSGYFDTSPLIPRSPVPQSTRNFRQAQPYRTLSYNELIVILMSIFSVLSIVFPSFNIKQILSTGMHAQSARWRFRVDLGTSSPDTSYFHTHLDILDQSFLLSRSGPFVPAHRWGLILVCLRPRSTFLHGSLMLDGEKVKNPFALKLHCHYTELSRSKAFSPCNNWFKINDSTG